MHEPVREAREESARALTALDDAWQGLADRGRLPARRTGAWAPSELRSNEILGPITAAADAVGELDRMLRQPGLDRETCAQLADSAAGCVGRVVGRVFEDAEAAAAQAFIEAHGEVRAEDNLLARLPRWFRSLMTARSGCQRIGELLRKRCGG